MSSSLPPRATRAFRLALRRPATAGDDMDEEIRFHLDARTEQLVRQGLSPEQARAEAARRFGSLSEARARLQRSVAHRENRLRLRELAGIVHHDARIAWRGLRRSPGFVALAVLCLALGIGANAAIYSVINAVLVRPLPFTDPARLVRVWPTAATPPGIYEILRKDSRSYSGLAGFGDAHKVSATGSGAPVRYIASDVTANLFDVLGVRPALGRTLRSGENAAGQTSVAVLSYGVWRDRYGANPGVIGTTVTIDGVARTIVGVMPADFHFPSADVQLWMPALFAPQAPTSYWWGRPLQLVARLEPSASIAQARAEAAILFPRARSAFPMRMPDEWGRDVDVVSLRESVVGAARPTLLLLFAAVGFVLLIACVNVATLYVDRAATREREIAIRAALGAGRARIVTQLLTESLMVASLGAAAGLVIAAAGVRVLVAMLPSGTARAAEIAVDGHVLAFTLVLAALSGVAFGLLPALRATKLDVQSSLRRDGRSGDAPRHTAATRALAIGQVALAVVIVTAAGLLLESFWRLHHVDLGFDTNHVLAAEVPLPSFDRDTTTRGPAFYAAVVARTRTIPGVRIAAAASSLPFGAIGYPAAMEIEAHPTPPGSIPAQPIRTAVTPDYFRALAIPLLRGRAFTDADRAGSPLVAIIDASAANAFWPSENAIGQRIRYVWNQNWFTVVGIVGDVTRDSLSGSVQPSLYLPMGQNFAEEMLIVARASTTADIAKISPALRTVVADVDPTVPVSDVHLLDGFVAESAARTRFATTLLTLFAAVALLLAATGIYGVMTAGVSRRRREIGVRMAMGATSRGVLRMVLRESAAVTAVGVVLGVAGAIAAGALLRGLLFGVGAIDLPVLIAVAALLAVVAVLAALAPARRASRINPLAAIRAE
jgi:putative ABC transport system permease protein